MYSFRALCVGRAVAVAIARDHVTATDAIVIVIVTETETEIGIGAAAYHQPNYPGSDVRSTTGFPFPYVIYRGDWFRIDRSLQGILYETQRVKLDFSAGAFQQQEAVALVEGVERFRVELGIDRRSQTNQVVDNSVAIDWVDEDKESRNGGDERGRYPDISSDFIPPNQPFKTVKEMHMVRGMQEMFYKILEGSFTIFGTKGVNVNYASKDVLMALDPTMTDEAFRGG